LDLMDFISSALCRICLCTRCGNDLYIIMKGEKPQFSREL
jgi:hypothetical protein